MKMILNIPFCFLSTLLLLNLVGAKPVSNLQSLRQLLEEENDVPYYASEELEGKDLNAEKGFGAAEVSLRDSDLERNSALAGKERKENALARLLLDLMATSKRSWGRFKKGGLRSCFGVRLERIGSFSGLGC